MYIPPMKEHNPPCAPPAPSSPSRRQPRRASAAAAAAATATTTMRPATFTLLAVLVLLVSPASGTNIEVEKTIKEELLPGAVVAELMAEPEVLRALEAARAATSPEVATGNGSLHFSVLTSGNAQAGYFGVDPTSGVVSVKRTIDREAVCSFRPVCLLEFEVALRSVLGSFFQLVRFAVTVTDSNDNAPEFTQRVFELNVPEESDAGRMFALPTAFDRDTGDGNGVREYRILQGPPMFELTDVNTTEVFLSLKSVVNREDAETYKILVGAVDGGNPPLTGTLTVAVQISDINDNSPVFKQAVYATKIPEDFGKDQPVQTVSATDADSGANGELVYTFSPRQPLENLQFFRIDPESGAIYLTRSIESRTGQEIELVVEARDKGHPPKVTRAKVEVFVEDTVNSMPTIIADPLGGRGGVAEVSEFATPGKVVAHVSVTDPDSGANGETKCSLDTPEFRLVSLGGAQGKFKAVLESGLDREMTDFYNVTVTCRDSGLPALAAQRQFQVRVLDENDHFPVFDPRAYPVSIRENNTIGRAITNLKATDKDIGVNANLTFTVAGINRKFFSVDPEGRMTALVPLDREESGRIVVTVIAADGGKPVKSATATVVVTLEDVNDCRPEFDTEVFEFDVQEGRPAGNFVGIVSASDRDSGKNQELFYHFLSPGFDRTRDGLFRVDLTGGVITTGAVLDREKAKTHTLLVLATDNGTPALTGTATVVVSVLDVNDNAPVFEFPLASSSSYTDWENESVSIPHTWDPAEPVVTVVARDADEGLNAQIIYSLSSINATTPFSVNPTTGDVMLDGELSPDDCGLYMLAVAATDQGPRNQHATAAPLYVDVYFDNSTLLLLGQDKAGPSRGLVLGLAVGVVLLVLAALLGVVLVVCVRRGRERRKLRGGVPNSASTSSTAKLQGGYYIAPGVRGSSDSILASKHSNGGHSAGNYNNGAVSPGTGDAGQRAPLTAGVDEAGGMRTANPYVVLLPRSNSAVPSEIIEISRTNGPASVLNDTADPDNSEDATVFSTFKSEEDILSPGFRNGSLRRQSRDASSIAKRSGDNDTFDEMSNDDDSTSDSGRGGSEVDINNGGAAAAAAAKEKARALAATPTSMKSGISNRLSPLPRGLDPERTFVTFRGDSPSSFRFDSDNDTLTRRRGRVPSLHSPSYPPSSPPGLDDGGGSNNNTLAAPPSRRFDFRRPSETDAGSGTDSELGAAAPRAGLFHRGPLFPAGPSTTGSSASSGTQYPHPQHIAGIYSPNVPGTHHAGGYSSGGEGAGGGGGRLPSRVPPLLPMFRPVSGYPQSRPESESDAQLSDSSGSSRPRSNHVPRLPYYPGMEFSHHAYGGSNRNSIGAFSNASALSNMEPPYSYYNQEHPTSASSFPAGDYHPQHPRSTSSTSSYTGNDPSYRDSGSDPSQRVGPDPRVSMNYGNVVSELLESRPVSMEADFLLPPYPEVDDADAGRDEEDDDDEDQLHMHSGYTGFSPHRDDERAALFSNSKLESSA